MRDHEDGFSDYLSLEDFVVSLLLDRLWFADCNEY